MLEFLENGWALYGLAAVSILGIQAALIGAHGYRKLFRQCRSMPDTRNKFLLQLKVKFENTYRVSGGIQNIRAFLERQVYQSRTFGISLYRWERACGQACDAVLPGRLGSCGRGVFLWNQSRNDRLICCSRITVKLRAGMVLFINRCKGEKAAVSCFYRGLF